MKQDDKAVLITIHVQGDVVRWWSSGWDHDKELMGKARSAIRRGKNRYEVIKNLKDSGFIVWEV